MKTDEYSALKAEQLERIKQRDGFLNLNVVGVGLVSTFAVQNETRSAAWLVVPWITFVFGWAFLNNDDKVSAIARHIKSTVKPKDAAGSWEYASKGLLPRSIRWVYEFVVFMLAFVLPTPAALVLFSQTYAQRYGWGPIQLAAVWAEVVALVALVGAYGVSMVSRIRTTEPLGMASSSRLDGERRGKIALDGTGTDIVQADHPAGRQLHGGRR